MTRLQASVLRYALGVVGALVVWGVLQVEPLRQTMHRNLPSFRIEERLDGGFLAVPSMSGGDQMGTGDYNGDGQLDVANFNRVGLLAQSFTDSRPQVLWARNYDPDCSISFNGSHDLEAIKSYRFYVGPGQDLTGDGCDESLATYCSHDGDQWFFEMVDGKTGAVLVKKSLPVGQDIRADGRWDGDYRAHGILWTAPREAGGTPLVILSRAVQYDRLGRGVLALDARTGEDVWTFELANNPLPAELHLVDLDGDGVREVVFLAGAAGNLGPDEKVDGKLDDHARVVVLGADGSPRWIREVTETWGSSGALRPLDLDGDDRPELVVGTATVIPDFPDHVFVFRGDGRLLGRGDLPDRARGILPHGDHPESGRFEVLVYGHDCLAFALGDTGLVLESRRQLEVTANYRGPVRLGDMENLFLLFDGPKVSLYHPDHGEMKVAHELDQGVRAIRPVSQPGGELVLVVLTDSWHFLHLVRTSEHRAATLALVAVPPIISLVPPAWYRRRRYRQTGVMGPAREEIKREIARRLKRDNHNRLSLFRSLESLLLNLEWAQDHTEDEDQRQGLLDRLRGRCERLARADLPGVLELGDLAESLGLAAGVRERLIRRHGEMAAFLSESFEQPDPLAYMREGFPRVRAAARDMEVDLEKLADEFATYEGVDLWAVIQDVLLDHRETVQQAGVQVSMGPPPAEDVRVILPREDLKHLFDNLVRNACRAMRDFAPRLLKVRVTVVGRRVLCDFADTGPGIDPEVRERLFRSPVSSQGGTGEGLYDSARLVVVYDGRLEAAEPESDDGARIRLTLPFL